MEVELIVVASVSLIQEPARQTGRGDPAGEGLKARRRPGSGSDWPRRSMSQHLKGSFVELSASSEASKATMIPECLKFRGFVAILQLCVG